MGIARGIMGGPAAEVRRGRRLWNGEQHGRVGRWRATCDKKWTDAVAMGRAVVLGRACGGREYLCVDGWPPHGTGRVTGTYLK